MSKRIIKKNIIDSDEKPEIIDEKPEVDVTVLMIAPDNTSRTAVRNSWLYNFLIEHNWKEA